MSTAGTNGTALSDFAAGYPFPLDPFQRSACAALEAGEGVLVAAPTGAGKTVVGEFAVHLALRQGRKCFYTTPIKALSNQKYTDLVAAHGEQSVGLLTGDVSRNGHAPVVVMTTEVLRNMIYADSDALRGLGYVVMDEVHYLSDRFRGAVWEEVIIHLPLEVCLVSLSATVSNAEEFAEWLVTVRGHTRVIVEEHRPVPLWQHVLADRQLLDLFVTKEADGDQPAAPHRINPELLRVAREQARWSPVRPGRGKPQVRLRTPSRPDVVARLDREGLLPAITFVFSRAGCDAAVRQCLFAGLRLNSMEESGQVRAYVAERARDIPIADLRVLGFAEWREGLEHGIAAHHAGLLPTFKEVVEHLFSRGLVKAVFATETLALGINMPARSVVLEKLSKWNGETHADISAGEYTQLTGRAGRRGIDVEGHAVVVWHQGLDPVALGGLAATRTYPLRSSFRPSYNMAVNLMDRVGRERARALLESSFAQFQADRSVVGLARQVKRNLAALEGYREAMNCHLGDAADYDRLRSEIRDREASLAREGAAQRRGEAARSLERLRPGDVVLVPAGRRSGLAVVLDNGSREREGPRPTVLTADRQVKRLSLVDFPRPVEPLARVRVPRSFNPRSPQARRDLASSLRNTGVEAGTARAHGKRSAAADDARLAQLRRALRAHAVHGCAEREDHLRWAERWVRLRRDTDVLERRVEGRTNTIARTFDRVCALLAELGYLADDRVTPAGRQLSRVYSEADLLVVECLREGIWDELSTPELAAAVSALVFESRGDRVPSPSGESAMARIPGAVRSTLARMVRLWSRLDSAETEHHLDFLREPDPGFAWAAHQWACGVELEGVLDEELTAGDFVRWTRQLIDLLDQIADVAKGHVAVTARAAVAGLRRGVVAYSF